MSDDHVSDSHMLDAPPVEDGHPWVSPGTIMTENEANAGRDLALKLQAEFDRLLPGYEVQEEDLPAIIKNPGAFDLNKRGFTIYKAKDVVQQHKFLSKHFLSYSIQGEASLTLPRGTPNLKATRNETMKEKARERDGFRCNMLKNALPEMAHVYPFSATGTSVGVLETNEAFPVTETLIGRQFYLKWRGNANQLGGFEDKDGGNIFAFNPYAHKFFDNGIIALRYLGPGHDRGDGKHYARIMLLWLPVCSRLTETKAILDQGSEDTVTRLLNEVETASSHGFQPRRPHEGTGSIWLCFDDGYQVRSGHTFEVGFFKEELRDNYGEMMSVSWEAMLQLTLAGKTKGLPPIIEEDEGDDDDNGGGKRLIKGKGKERASSPARDAAPPSTPAPAPPRRRRASGRPPLISRSTAVPSRALASSPGSPPAPVSIPAPPCTSGSSVATSRAYQSTNASRARSYRHDPLGEGRPDTGSADVRRRSARLRKPTGAAPGSGTDDK